MDGLDGLIDCVAQRTTAYLDGMPKETRKKYGQFFTGKETARFMAEMFDLHEVENIVNILDPGAGSGILSIALIERLLKERQSCKVNLVCYENDENIIGILQENLLQASKASQERLKFEIRDENYITSQAGVYNGWLGAEQNPPKYDLIIGNPPYMKIAKDAPEAKSMQDVCYGAPNMYFLFTAMSSFNLKQGGEMVYIVPRSWTSGSYFGRFREKFLTTCKLSKIHLFASRDKVFQQESVLQETMIFKALKGTKTPKAIQISTTESSADYSAKQCIEVPYETVVSGVHNFVFLPTTMEEVALLKKIGSWRHTLPELGLAMKTGLTVDFRNKDCLRSSPGDYTVPLFFSQHIQEGKVSFPIGKENEYITTTQPGLLQDNKNYLFVKRFTAKEERRRLQCGVYLARKHPEYKKISTQNKINFIGGPYELSECMVYGLFVLFNSTAYDRYYRILDGSTQVNASEINTMPVPHTRLIEQMGKTIMARKDFSVASCDEVLRGCFLEENG